MRTLLVAFVGGIVGTVFTTMIVLAWSGPTSAPPNGNVAAPINVGTVDQVKNAGLAINTLAIFGDAILSGASHYINFGTTAGATGYGIRDNAGTMEFKDGTGAWRRFLPATNVQSIQFADGTTQTTAPSAGGVTGYTQASCSFGGSGCVATCPSGYYRSGCDGTGASPSGNGCSCYAGYYGSGTCYAYCVR